MSRYVVDTSVVVQRLIREEHTEYARSLFARLVTNDELIVPESRILECTNVLWKRVRFHGMAESQADDLISDLVSLPLQVWAITPLLKRALQIGLTHQLAVYDSCYIALAEMLDCPLITIDEKQSMGARNERVGLKSLQDFKPVD